MRSGQGIGCPPAWGIHGASDPQDAATRGLCCILPPSIQFYILKRGLDGEKFENWGFLTCSVEQFSVALHDPIGSDYTDSEVCGQQFIKHPVQDNIRDGGWSVWEGG